MPEEYLMSSLFFYFNSVKFHVFTTYWPLCVFLPQNDLSREDERYILHSVKTKGENVAT